MYDDFMFCENKQKRPFLRFRTKDLEPLLGQISEFGILNSLRQGGPDLSLTPPSSSRGNLNLKKTHIQI